MKKLLPFTTLLALLIVGMVYLRSNSEANNSTPPRPASGVNMPFNYQTEFVHYATIDRGDGTVRDLYISPRGLENFRSSAPDQTVIVIDGYDARVDANGEFQVDANGHLFKGAPFDKVHVIEKRDDWRNNDFVNTNRSGEWNFGSFWAENGERSNEDVSACFNCHNATAHTDFLYTQSLLSAFARTGNVQYSYCELPDRIAC